MTRGPASDGAPLQVSEHAARQKPGGNVNARTVLRAVRRPSAFDNPHFLPADRCFTANCARKPDTD